MTTDRFGGGLVMAGAGARGRDPGDPRPGDAQRDLHRSPLRLRHVAVSLGLVRTRVGAGVVLAASYEAKAFGVRPITGAEVTLVTRAPDAESTNTFWAQGGIIYEGENDTPASLVHDIIKAGAGISNV